MQEKEAETAGQTGAAWDPTEPKSEIQPFWRPSYIPALETHTLGYAHYINPVFVYNNLSSFLLSAIKECQVIE